MTNARVGQQTDYDKLTLEVWTNGSLKPQDAVAYTAKILKEQVSISSTSKRPKKTQIRPLGLRRGALNENLFGASTSWSSVCAARTACQNANIQLIGELVPAHRAGHAKDEELRA